MAENETEEEEKPEEVQEEEASILGGFEMPVFSMDDVFDSSLLEFDW